jgi:hypothetical protein
MISLLYLPTASERGLVWHGHSSKRWHTAQLLSSPVGRLYYSLAVAFTSHITRRCSLGCRCRALCSRLCWTAVQYSDPNRHGLTTGPSKQPWGGHGPQHLQRNHSI